MLMAFKMTGVLKCSLQSCLLSSSGSPRKRTVESTSEFKHFMLFQIWHKPTTRLWIMLLTDTNSFRLWKDEKVCTRQCLLHYLLPCITSIIKNAAMVSEEWKTGTRWLKLNRKMQQPSCFSTQHLSSGLWTTSAAADTAGKSLARAEQVGGHFSQEPGMANRKTPDVYRQLLAQVNYRQTIHYE